MVMMASLTEMNERKRFNIAKAVFTGIRNAHADPAYEAAFRAWLRQTRGEDALREYEAQVAARIEAQAEQEAKEALRQELRRKLEALG